MINAIRETKEDASRSAPWETIVGHQLKTSLCAMLADIDTRTKVEPADIGENIQRMLRLIDQLQVAGLCRRDAGLELRPRNLADTLLPAAARIAPLALRRRQKIQFRDFSRGKRCLMDTTLAQEAASNIIENAIKYAPVDSRIVVAVTATGRFHVLDEGPGVPLDEVQTLFEPFRRGAFARRYPGSGLGLSLVNRIMSGHGGKAGFQNRKSRRGSAFTLSFLCADENGPKEAAMQFRHRSMR
ncbi:MAG: ATP-binding protein [Pseudomonadota bacterium]